MPLVFGLLLDPENMDTNMEPGIVNLDLKCPSPLYLGLNVTKHLELVSKSFTDIVSAKDKP